MARTQHTGERADDVKARCDLRFTHNPSRFNYIPFLDVLIVNTEHTFHTTVYRKPNSAPSYLHFKSHAPISHKITTVKTISKRIYTHCSLDCFKKNEKRIVYNHLSSAGYPHDFILSILIIPHSLYTSLRHPITKSSIKTNPLTATNAIYKIPCLDCEQCYIGETGRSICARLSEHSRNIRTNDRKSLLCQHITEFRHSFNLDSTVCVYKGVRNKYQRLVLESLVSHCTPSFNRKIDLPPQYSVFYLANPPS
ncbi:hypothetical protein LAZ67_9000528 [Cordylochernes scorpioides]|uniref:Helix-turn-helix domain-containing protein n=1 Tax=Cordylochernes scorpioides TaxID=51811 RepID=A0ABY6KU59_9ARAC|nr:hypothetical protein LAZ67_9000528 [Cordylochernes scorpioides]